MASEEQLEIIRKIIRERRQVVAERSKKLKQSPSLVERIKTMTEEELDALLEETKKPKQHYGTITDFLALMPGFARTYVDDVDDDEKEPNP
jgi:Glu-tRNA(Gln) amidotransferase subunit E-like FAD-binding protein